MNALRVGFDLTGLELDSAGSARAVRGLQAALERRDDVEVVPLAQPGSSRSRVARGLARELGWYPFGLPRRARGVDVLHCPMPLAPPRSPVPLVVSIYDTFPWEHPEWFGRAIVLQHRLLLAPAVRRAARVVTCSEHSRGRIAEVLGLSPDRIDVTPLGVDGRFAPGEERREHLLAVATLEPRKDLETVVRAYERLRDPPPLVVAGARGWRYDRLLERLEQSPARDRIRLTGRVSDDELVRLYRSALCLVMASRDEGFGFPVLEAMACGTPVVCARAGALPEVAGDVGSFFAPGDADELAGAVEALLADDGRRAELGRAGVERAAGFTWDRCAELTVDAYRRAR